MSDLLSITRPLPFALFAGASSPASGLDNLLTPDPREVMQADAAGACTIVMDLGAMRNVDTVFLGYTNATPGGTFTVKQDGQTAFGSSLVAHSYRRAPRHHCFVQLAAPASARYLYLTVPCAGRLVAGVLAAGLTLRPSRGHEKGNGRPIFDTSVVQRQFSGGFGIQRGQTAGGWQVTIFPTDVERDQLYAMMLDLGVGGSLLVAEHNRGGPGFNEALHWGLLSKLEPYSRDDPDESKWSLQIGDWA